MAGISGAIAESCHERTVHYTLVSPSAGQGGPAEDEAASRSGERTNKAAIVGSVAAAVLLACGLLANWRTRGVTSHVSALTSKADRGTWKCHNYVSERGEMDDWCRTVGEQGGWEYRMTEADGTCGSCWCCKRFVGGNTTIGKEAGADGDTQPEPEQQEEEEHEEEHEENEEEDEEGDEQQEESPSAGDQPSASPPQVIASLSDPVSLKDFARDAFPGQVYDWYKRDNPLFFGTDFSVDFDCTEPYPSVYFDNPEVESKPLFRGEWDDFPMASEYFDTTGAFTPKDGERQTVIGMVEMQGPYYAFAEDLNPPSPYLVMSMDSWTEQLNYEFVQCALRGWPGTPSLATGEWTIRVVLKNSEHGHDCNRSEAAHAPCNLRTSWGTDPENGVWRSTTREVNTLIELCNQKYHCEVRKMQLEPQEDKEIPQVWLWKTISERAVGEVEDDGGEDDQGEDGQEGNEGSQDGAYEEGGDVAPAPAEPEVDGDEGGADGAYEDGGDVAPAPAEPEVDGNWGSEDGAYENGGDDASPPAKPEVDGNEGSEDDAYEDGGDIALARALPELGGEFGDGDDADAHADSVSVFDVVEDGAVGFGGSHPSLAIVDDVPADNVRPRAAPVVYGVGPGSSSLPGLDVHESSVQGFVRNYESS